MPSRKITFTEDGVYHICSRAVDGKTIFRNDKDYFRAVHDLYEFNDEAAATPLHYKAPFLNTYETRSHRVIKKRKLLVEILAFALLPNHYHLLLKQLQDNGIVRFMHKFGLGYAKYFNQKYNRTGILFQGPFRSVRIERQAHFTHIPFYIHANPLDLKFPTWRERKLANPKKAMEFLENYRWSSFPDYVGKKNFPSVTQRNFLTAVMGTPKAYKKATMELLQEMDLGIIHKVALEDTNAIL